MDADHRATFLAVTVQISVYEQDLLTGDSVYCTFLTCKYTAAE